MRFRVPQFIDVKNKIFGPLTLKQFLYLAGGGGLCTIIWFMVPWTFLAILLILPVAALALALAFYEVNERPFIEILEAAFYYAISSKLFIWQRRRERRAAAGSGGDAGQEGDEAGIPDSMPRVSQSKLKDMTWDLDVASGAEGAEEAAKQAQAAEGEDGQDTTETRSQQ